MHFEVLPESTLVLFEYWKGFRLFCTSSMILFEVPATSWQEARQYAEAAQQEWTAGEIEPQEKTDGGLFLTVCLTQDCNLTCQYCYLHGECAEWPVKNLPSTPDFSQDLIRTEIRNLISSSPSRLGITFFGGEPLLHADAIMEITEFAQGLGVEQETPVGIGLTTNGTLLDKRFLEWACNKNVSIMLSLDSPPELHDRYRARGHSSNTFDEIAGRIRGFEQDITVVTMITAKTPSFREALQPLLKLGFRQVCFNLVHTRDTELLIDASAAQHFQWEWEAEQEWFAAHVDRIGNLRQIQDLISKREMTQSPCSAGDCGYAIAPDGRKYFCHSCVGHSDFEIDKQRRPVSETLKSIYAAGSQNSTCRTCWARRLCGGECWLIKWEYGEKERNTRCQLIRGLVKLALSTYRHPDGEK